MKSAKLCLISILSFCFIGLISIGGVSANWFYYANAPMVIGNGANYPSHKDKHTPFHENQLHINHKYIFHIEPNLEPLSNFGYFFILNFLITIHNNNNLLMHRRL